MMICKGSGDRGREKREERQMERGREMVENRAEDTAFFHGLALPSAEAACAFTGIPLRFSSHVPPLTSAIHHQQPLLLASLQPPTSPTVVLFARVGFPVS